MKSFSLSQTGIYHLQQLANLVKQKTGVRHKLSDHADMINLLRYSSTSSDETICATYTDFTESLEDDQQGYLTARGILSPLFIKQGNSKRSTLFPSMRKR